MEKQLLLNVTVVEEFCSMLETPRVFWFGPCLELALTLKLKTRFCAKLEWKFKKKKGVHPALLTNYNNTCKDRLSRTLMYWKDAKKEEDTYNDIPCSPGTLPLKLQEFYNTQKEYVLWRTCFILWKSVQFLAWKGLCRKIITLFCSPVESGLWISLSQQSTGGCTWWFSCWLLTPWQNLWRCAFLGSIRSKLT